MSLEFGLLTDYTKEIVLSDDILKRSSDSYRRIRNTIRFILGNLSDYSDQKISPENLTELDKWMLKRTKKLQEEIREDYLNYNFHFAFQKIHNFCANDLGGFYLDILKDRLYTANLIPMRVDLAKLYYRIFTSFVAVG